MMFLPFPILLYPDGYVFALLFVLICYSTQVINLFSFLCYLNCNVFTVVYLACRHLGLSVCCLITACGSAFSMIPPTSPIERLADPIGLSAPSLRP